MSARFEELAGTAILGIDTLWGGDVMCPSGTGRFIADSWFSEEPLPPAYTDPLAAVVRESSGVSAKNPNREAIEAYLKTVDIPAAIRGLEEAAKHRGVYVANLAMCFRTMWDLAMEMLDKGEPVSYHRCVNASTGRNPEPSDPAEKRRQVRQLINHAGYATVQDWRIAHLLPMASVRTLGQAVVQYFDHLAQIHVAPHLPAALATVPRANVEFLPIRDAWFSGSMNYLGRARKADGSPEYEATYEINASLEISVPEFLQLVSHEVVPGHVTTFAYLQNLYARGVAGFEASVLTMNTRAATLFEGIANNAILMAYGVNEVEELPDSDLQIGVLLALLQDDAKNQASYLTWQEKLPQAEVASILQEEYLVSAERAGKLSGAWGRHPLLGRMYLPAYRAGTEHVAALRRRYPANRFLPVVFGCSGLVDVSTIESILQTQSTGA